MEKLFYFSMDGLVKSGLIAITGVFLTIVGVAAATVLSGYLEDSDGSNASVMLSRGVFMALASAIYLLSVLWLFIRRKRFEDKFLSHPNIHAHLRSILMTSFFPLFMFMVVFDEKTRKTFERIFSSVNFDQIRTLDFGLFMMASMYMAMVLWCFEWRGRNT